MHCTGGRCARCTPVIHAGHFAHTASFQADASLHSHAEMHVHDMEMQLRWPLQIRVGWQGGMQGLRVKPSMTLTETLLMG